MYTQGYHAEGVAPSEAMIVKKTFDTIFFSALSPSTRKLSALIIRLNREDIVPGSSN